MIPLYEMSRTGTYIEAESPLVVASAKEKCKMEVGGEEAPWLKGLYFFGK